MTNFVFYKINIGFVCLKRCDLLCVYVCVYYVCVCAYIYIYIFLFLVSYRRVFSCPGISSHVSRHVSQEKIVIRNITCDQKLTGPRVVPPVVPSE